MAARTTKSLLSRVLGHGEHCGKVERELPGDVESLELLVSADQLKAGLEAPWLQLLIYGSIIEKRVEMLRLRSPLLTDLTYQGAHVVRGVPDWTFSWAAHTGPSDPNHHYLQYIELTTELEAPMRQAKYGLRAAIVTYRRPPETHLRQLFKGLNDIGRYKVSAADLEKRLEPQAKEWAETVDALDRENHAVEFAAWEREGRQPEHGLSAQRSNGIDRSSYLGL